MNNGFAIRPGDSVTNEEQPTCDEGQDALGVLLGAIRADSPDLATVIEAWPALPKAVRKALLAMVQSVTEGDDDER